MKRKIGFTLLGISTFTFLSYSTTKLYYQKRISVLFPGEPKSFEIQYDELLNIPASQMLPILGEGVCSPVLLQPTLNRIGLGSFAEKKSKKAFEKLITKYPDCFVGYTGLSWWYNNNNNKEEAEKYYNKSQEIAKNNPKWTNACKDLLPNNKTLFFDPNSAKIEPKFIQVNDNIWCIKAPFKLKDTSDFIFIQSSIIRLDDNSIIIINPTAFSDETIEKINNLGIVKVLITPTGPHGVALARAHKIWPNAKLYGTDNFTKHDEPELPWNGFFTSDGLTNIKKEQITEYPYDNFLNDFEYYFLSGHLFKECVFYHKSSKTLFGITDMFIYTENDSHDVDNTPWGFKAYFYALGLYRPDLDSPVASQSYHTMFCTDHLRLASCARKILNLDIETITFGHGGVITGKENCSNALQTGFRWVLNHNPSMCESVMAKCIWRQQYKLPF